MNSNFRNSGLYSLTMKIALLVTLLAVVGCGGSTVQPRPAQPTPPVTITAAQVFTPHVGDVWTFRNGFGDLTTITQIAVQPSNYIPAGSIVFDYTKKVARAYPAINVDGAEYLFVLSPQPDGSWVSKVTLFNFPNATPAWSNGNHLWSADFEPIPGMPTPYIIVPAGEKTGSRTNVPTAYRRWDSPGVLDWDSFVSGPFAEQVRWETDSYIENVDTPVYSGPALVSDQFESVCGHEKWYFAPGHGLVKVIPLDDAAPQCGHEDPNTTMVRID